MTARATGTAAWSGWVEEQCLAGIFCGREVRKWLVVVRLSAAYVVFGIEGLDAADELRERLLYACFGDGGITKRHREEHSILGNGGEARD